MTEDRPQAILEPDHVHRDPFGKEVQLQVDCYKCQQLPVMESTDEAFWRKASGHNFQHPQLEPEWFCGRWEDGRRVSGCGKLLYGVPELMEALQGRVESCVACRNAAVATPSAQGGCTCQGQDYRHPDQVKHDVALVKDKANLPTLTTDQMLPRQPTFDNFNDRVGLEEALTIVKAWANGDYPQRFIVLAGKPGTGKTHLIAAALHHAISRGKSARYEDATNMYWRTRGTFDPNYTGGESEFTIVNNLLDADFAALDDVGAEKVTDWTEAMLFNIVNQKYASTGRMILSFNPDLIVEKVGGRDVPKVGDRVMRRMTDRAVAKVIHIEAGNYYREE